MAGAEPSKRLSALRNLLHAKTVECTCDGPDHVSFIELLGIFAILTSIATFFDRFTPTFSYLLTFKPRILIAIALLICIILAACRIITARHTLSFPSLDGQAIKTFHYTYRKRDRVLAMLAIVPLLLAAGICVADLRYWKGIDGTLEGVVVGAEGAPVEFADVDLLNLDRKSILKKSSKTGSNDGLFFLEISNTKGGPAYYSIKTNDCVETMVERLSSEDLTKIIPEDHENDLAPNSRVVFVFRCPRK